jgi:hypothetical protein
VAWLTHYHLEQLTVGLEALPKIRHEIGGGPPHAVKPAKELPGQADIRNPNRTAHHGRWLLILDAARGPWEV